jgi:hypothetical protein
MLVQNSQMPQSECRPVERSDDHHTESTFRPPHEGSTSQPAVPTQACLRAICLCRPKWCCASRWRRCGNHRETQQRADTHTARLSGTSVTCGSSICEFSSWWPTTVYHFASGSKITSFCEVATFGWPAHVFSSRDTMKQDRGRMQSMNHIGSALEPSRRPLNDMQPLP